MIVSNTKCKICHSNSLFIFKGVILNKFEISYYKCTNCGFIQTEKPYWLNEAYKPTNLSLDVGVVYRNLSMFHLTRSIINKYFTINNIYLDYAGGYGLFVRLMRDDGYNFYRYDKYSDNIFARGFDISDISHNEKFELITSFELFEHLDEPLLEIGKIFDLSGNILFTTDLIPDQGINNINDWAYFMPEGGQHISFYTQSSLKYIAELFNCILYTNNTNLHLLTRNKLSVNPFKNSLITKIKNRIIGHKSQINKRSLISQDFEYLQNKMKTTNGV